MLRVSPADGKNLCLFVLIMNSKPVSGFGGNCGFTVPEVVGTEVWISGSG